MVSNVKLYKIIKCNNVIFFLFRAKAKDPSKRTGDYEETQEEYEKRLEEQKIRQRKLREGETSEQQASRKKKDATAKAMVRLYENDEDWNN